MFAQEQKVILPEIRDDLKLLETSIAEDGSKRWLLFDPIQNKYFDIVRVKINPDKILKSISLIMNSGVDYEFRTTVLKSQLSYEDFEKIGEMIKGVKKYYLQKFVPSNILDQNLINATTYTDTEFKTICDNLKTYVEFVDYR